MSRVHALMRRALWLACGVMVALPLSAQADEEALRETLRLFWQKSLYEPPRIKSLDALEQERITPPAQHDELARLQLKKLFYPREMSRDAQRLRLYQGLSLYSVEIFQLGWEEGQSWRELGLSGNLVAPDWVIDYVADEIQKMSIPRGAGNTQPAAAPRGRQEFTWGSQRDSENNRTIIQAAQALAFAGPAVKDGVATYRKVPGGTAVRLPLSASLDELDSWIMSHDLGLALSLRRDVPRLVSEPLVIEGRTAVPAWLVSPTGLQAATLTAFSFVIEENFCSDSNWMEFQFEGDKAPPVWAVLLLPQEDMAKDASVKRLPNAKPDENSGEAQRGELEVRWTNNWLPPLRLTARRFDVAFSDYEDTPDGNWVPVRSEPIGSAWKVEVRALPDGKPLVTDFYHEGYTAPLSRAGTPRCAPR
jgi:hypothetical protein